MEGAAMKVGWLLGWAVPETWFAPLVSEVFPKAEHIFVAAAPDALAQLEKAGPFDWMAGYSLGSLLLLSESARASQLGRVALLAPIFAFPREAGLGGRVARVQVQQLSRWLRRDARAALADFYTRAGLDVSPVHAVAAPEILQWGLERLENDRAELPLPLGWRAWCGANDVLLDAARLHSLAPTVKIVAGTTHHPSGLLSAFAIEVARVEATARASVDSNRMERPTRSPHS
jgi:hypothetical protein